MNNKHISKAIAIVLSTLIIASALASCSMIEKVESANATTESTTETTTETTTVKQTTTEDENTTFAESQTNKIYEGLSKDKDGEYPYKLAEYTTYYHTSDKSRTANLKAAVSKVDNLKVPKDKVFSFNQTVGKRTVTAGYQEAKVISNGEFVDGLGGGVCQVSSTIFECVLRANVKIVYRTNHTLGISYVPMGGDATVQWNSKDFQFKNTTGTDIRISLKCDNGRLTCTVWGKDDVKVGNVKVSITKSGDTYTLVRYVDGVENYRTKSRYKQQKKSTTKKATTKKADEKKTTKKA